MPVNQNASQSEISQRESTWVTLCARGFKDHEIAREMGITTHTVRFHANALMKKLGARSRAHAVYLVMKRGKLGRGSESADLVS